MKLIVIDKETISLVANQLDNDFHDKEVCQLIKLTIALKKNNNNVKGILSENNKDLGSMNVLGGTSKINNSILLKKKY